MSATLDDLLDDIDGDEPSEAVVDETVVIEEAVVEETPRKRTRQAPQDPPPPPEVSEVAIIAAIPTGPITLSTGTQLELEPLKARQFFRLLKIVTRGAGPLLMEYPLDLDDDQQLVIRLTALVAMSIPEAEDEAIDFIKSMCRPANLEESQDKAAQARNLEKYEQLSAELTNPEIDDLLMIIEAIIEREAPDLRSLGKRVRSLIDVARKAGQLPKS